MFRRRFAMSAASLALLAATVPNALAQQAKESTEGLDMQAARAKMMSVRGKKIAYTKSWDLSGLPKYAQSRR